MAELTERLIRMTTSLQWSRPEDVHKRRKCRDKGKRKGKKEKEKERGKRKDENEKKED